MSVSRLKVLLVDDHPNMRTMLIQILRSAGVTQTVQANDGSEGLQKMREHDIDIVLTDLAMEPIDGIDFVRMIRNSPDSPNPQVPVIMVTGHLTMSRIQEARDAGVNEFVAKPITVRNVLERLQVTIDHPRSFIRTDDFFGPDRRRRNDPLYAGPKRRKADEPEPASPRALI